MASPSPSSLSPPSVPMELFAQNRRKLVAALRDHLASISNPVNGFILLQVTAISLYLHSINRSLLISPKISLFPNRVVRSRRDTARITLSSLGIDRFRVLWGLGLGECKIRLFFFEHICRQESYFAYLFGVREPGFYGAIVSFRNERFLKIVVVI